MLNSILSSFFCKIADKSETRRDQIAPDASLSGEQVNEKLKLTDKADYT